MSQQSSAPIVPTVELASQDHDYAAVSAQINSDVWNFMSQYSLP